MTGKNLIEKAHVQPKEVSWAIVCLTFPLNEKWNLPLSCRGAKGSSDLQSSLRVLKPGEKVMVRAASLSGLNTDEDSKALMAKLPADFPIGASLQFITGSPVPNGQRELSGDTVKVRVNSAKLK